MRKLLIGLTSTLPLVIPISLISCSSPGAGSPSYITNNSKYFSDSFVKKLQNKLDKIKDNNFYLINGIYLTDSNLRGDDAQFDFKSREIFISSYNIKNNIKKQNWNEDVKAEYIYQLVFHEYNHFLNSLYLNNIYDQDPQLNKSIYHKFTNREPERWNEHFLNEFKHILKYDQNTALYSSNKIKNKYVSLGSVYNQKNLFDIANGQVQPDFPLLTGKEVMAPLTYDQYLPIDDHHIIFEGSLAYLYSMQELVARKMQIINMEYVPFTKNNQGLDANGWIFDENGNHIWSPYLQDIVNYQGAMNSNDLYLQDKPTQALSTLYSGYVDNNSNVRQITYKNNIKREHLNDFVGNVDKSQISFSGVYSKDVKVGYLDNGSFVEIPSKWITYKNKHEYHTEYFDKVSVLNKPLAFKDGNNIIEMSSVRTGNYGVVTTYDSFNSKDNNLKVIKENSHIIIKTI